MRCYTLSFDIANTDAARKYIVPGATFICDGQGYDIQGFKKQSGANGNTTSVSANHVGLRLLNYSLAAGYSFVGTVAQIAADILDKSVNTSGVKASTEFEIGTTPDLGTISFSLNNTDAVTARYAIMALKDAGAEMDWDNFTINFAEEIGGGQTQTFEFGVNMSNVDITYDKSNGTTYEINIADLQIKNPADRPFGIGWYAHCTDSTTGEEFTKRIITYTRCLDNPTLNCLTLGVFVRDAGTEAAMQSIKMDSTVQQGTEYNNVSVDHMHGFMSVSADGLSRKFDNGTDGYIIQQKVNDNWVTVWQANKGSDGGVSTAYNLAHTLKVELGGANGLSLYTGSDSAWTLVSEFGAGGLNANVITTLGSHVKGRIGTDATYGDGLFLYYDNILFAKILPLGPGDNGLLISTPDYSSQLRLYKNSATLGCKASNGDFVVADLGGTDGEIYMAAPGQSINLDSSGFTCTNGWSGSFTGADTVHVRGGTVTGIN